MGAYTYEITARMADRGWQLRLLKDGEEMGGGMFPVPEASTNEIMTWWNEMDIAGRNYWLDQGAASPAAAYYTLLLVEAHAAADAEGQAWVGRHQEAER